VKYAAFGQLENRICLHQAASQGNLNFSNNENQSSERARLFLTTAEIAERASRPFSIELANPKTLAARGTAALDPYISRHFYQKMPCSFFVDVDPCVVVLMKSRLRVNLTSGSSNGAWDRLMSAASRCSARRSLLFKRVAVNVIPVKLP
jgi:hypothetical protein